MKAFFQRVIVCIGTVVIILVFLVTGFFTGKPIRQMEIQMPTDITMSPELLAAIVGVMLALGFRYVPKLNEWYSALSSEVQSGIMALLLVVSAIAIFLANCGQFIIVVNLECTKQGAWDALWYLFLALNTNQAAYQIAVRPFPLRK